MKKLRKFRDQIGDSVANATERVRDVAPDMVENAKERLSDASESVSDRFDEVSGDAVYRLVMERLQQQDDYNDILATKLQEALSRIRELEAEMDRLRKA
jgi:transcriptional regulator NrdR family protein